MICETVKSVVRRVRRANRLVLINGMEVHGEPWVNRALPQPITETRKIGHKEFK